MAKQTLLELVQSILSSMDSDEVNSISDTVESYDIALLLRDLYYDISVELNLEAHETLFELTESGDSSQPTLMYLPDNVAKLSWIKYDNKETGDTNSNYQEVLYTKFDKFFLGQSSLREDTSGVGEMTFSMNDEEFEIMYRTDSWPTLFTAIGNNVILFNNINEDYDTTLQKSKTMCSGLVYPTFTLEDTFVPDLDEAQFPYYRNRGKVRAFAEKKQAQNQEASSEARNQKILMQKRKHRINEGLGLNQSWVIGKYGKN